MFIDYQHWKVQNMFKAIEINKVKNGYKVTAVSGALVAYITVSKDGLGLEESTFKEGTKSYQKLLKCAIKALKDHALID